MKASPLQIAWHNDYTPIYSVHFDPNGKGRLATSGKYVSIRHQWALALNANSIHPVITTLEYAPSPSSSLFPNATSLTASIAVEGGMLRGREKDCLLEYAGETHPGCKRSALLSQRYATHPPASNAKRVK